MKKLMLIAIMALPLLSTAQITLEKSYSNYGNVTVHNLEDQGHKYMVVDNQAKRVYLFNSNHSIWKTINIPVGVNEIFGGATYPSTKLFDTDGGVEIIVNIRDTSGGGNKGKMLILNENGSIIKTIQDCYYGYVSKVDNDWKLIAQHDQGYSEVYSLPGKLLGVQKPGKGGQEASSFSYPNPAADRVHINYTLPEGANSGTIQLYNNSGSLIKRMPINDRAGTATIERGSIPSGTFYYILESDNGSSDQQPVIFK